MFIRARILVLLAAIAPGCGNPPESPPAPSPKPHPTPAPLPPIDGEYAVRLDALRYTCGDASQLPSPRFMIADVIEQADAHGFDLKLRSYIGVSSMGTAQRDSGGMFHAESMVSWPGSSHAEDSIVYDSDGTIIGDQLAFLLVVKIGWTENGVFHTDCEAAYAVTGTARYRPWSGAPRKSIDGQWRILRRVTSDTSGALGLDQTLTVDTVTQSDDDSAFDLFGPKLYFTNVPRNSDGAVKYYVVRPNEELFLDGTITDSALDLTLVRKHYDDANVLTWRREERLTGTPRFEPADPDEAQPFAGSWNARMFDWINTCTGVLSVRHRVIDAVPAGEGKVTLRFMGAETYPFAPEPDGTFRLLFEGNLPSDAGDIYVIGGTVDRGHFVGGIAFSFENVSNPQLSCVIETSVKAVKRYRPRD